MRRRSAALALLLGAASLCVLAITNSRLAVAQEQMEADSGDDTASPMVWLATVAPGDMYWERFGHNALILVPEHGGPAISFNFGYFDFSQPQFLRRFLRGRVHYQSLALPAAYDLPGYAEEDRTVFLQALALSPQQARRLHSDLERSMLPEHRDYLYDYFTANCSTRLRDALDLALDGELRRQTSSRSRGYTYRMHAVRLAQGDFWLALGIDLGLGPYADRPLNFWQEMFIPEMMRRHLREFRQADGSMLVLDESVWFDSGRLEPPELPANRVLPFTLIGLAVAIALLFLSGYAHGRHRRGTQHPHADRTLRGLGFALHLLFGLAGTILLLLWLVTDHVAGHGNENLLLLNPLSLLLAPLWLRRTRGPAGTALAVLIVACAAFALASKTLPDFFIQANLHWCLLLLPIHLALLRSWLRRPTTAHS